MSQWLQTLMLIFLINNQDTFDTNKHKSFHMIIVLDSLLIVKKSVDLNISTQNLNFHNLRYVSVVSARYPMLAAVLRRRLKLPRV